MQPSICSRCGRNPAVVFITKIEGSQTKSEGLCLKCARELHIKPVDDILTKMGISDEDLENLSGEMLNAMNGVEELMGVDPEDSQSEDEDGKTATLSKTIRVKPDCLFKKSQAQKRFEIAYKDIDSIIG